MQKNTKNICIFREILRIFAVSKRNKNYKFYAKLAQFMYVSVKCKIKKNERN